MKRQRLIDKDTQPAHGWLRTRDGCVERNSILTIEGQGHFDLLVVTTRVEAVADLNPAAAFPLQEHHRCAGANEEPYPARLLVIISPQCSWNDHSWVLRMCRMSER